MILEIKFNNYKMFKNENTLSFFADTRIKRLSSNYFNVLNRNVLKSVSLYGQNNIGKSNVLYLLKLIRDLMLGAENIPFNRDIFGDSPRSDFSIIYKTDSDSNWMELCFTYDSFKAEIIKEELNEVTYYETGNCFKKNIEIQCERNIIYIIILAFQSFIILHIGSSVACPPSGNTRPDFPVSLISIMQF